MASNGFSVQIGEFQAAAPKFTDAGDNLASVTDLQSFTLDGLGAFWGTTAHGPEFGTKYQEMAAKALSLATACALSLQGIGDGLIHMGRQYQATDSTIANKLRGMS